MMRASDALRLPALALVTVGTVYLAWMGLDGSLAGFSRQRLPALDTGLLGERVLVIAPHPDDETLGTGGLVSIATGERRHVTVAVVTCGDGFRRIVGPYRHAGNRRVSPYVRLGEARASESRAAMRLLGLPSGALVFLGYPDGSLAQLWDDDAHREPLRGANGATSVPYDFAYRSGAPYTGSSVASDLAALIASVSPTAVVYPDADDSNADHWAVNAFMEIALDRAGYRGRRYTYLVHRGHFPFPWAYLPRGMIGPPRALRRIGVEWLSLPLDPATERAKARALESYASQWKAMEPFLTAFVRRNEMFGVRSTAVVASSTPIPAENAREMPGVVLSDPGGDTLLRVVDPAGDLRAVAMVRSGDELWLGVEAQGAPSRALRYLISVRLLREDGSEGRIDAELHERKANLLVLGPGSVASATPLASRVDARRIWVRLPASVLAGSRTALVGATAREGDILLDRTACATVLLR